MVNGVGGSLRQKRESLTARTKIRLLISQRKCTMEMLTPLMLHIQEMAPGSLGHQADKRLSF